MFKYSFSVNCMSSAISLLANVESLTLGEAPDMINSGFTNILHTDKAPSQHNFIHWSVNTGRMCHAIVMLLPSNSPRSMCLKYQNSWKIVEHQQRQRRVTWSCPNLVAFSAVITIIYHKMIPLNHVDGAVVKWLWFLPDSPVVAGSNLGRRTTFDNIYLRHIKPINTW